eukprot:7388992-Prymnesium_polylepis.1
MILDSLGDGPSLLAYLSAAFNGTHTLTLPAPPAAVVVVVLLPSSPPTAPPVPSVYLPSQPPAPPPPAAMPHVPLHPPLTQQGSPIVSDSSSS